MNYEVLHNFPQDIISELKLYWEENKNSKDISLIYVLKRFDPPEINHILEKMNCGASDIGYLIAPPNYGIAIPHIDNNRLSALNIPIDVEPEKNFFYTFNKDKEYTRENCPEYVEENFDHYNLSKPCILNTACPHGWATFMDRERVLCTISFAETPYSELAAKIPKEWF